MSALCDCAPDDALTRAFLGLALDGTPPDYGAGWFYDAGRGRRAHYFPQGTAQSACWRWERPEGWPPPDAAPAGPACARCQGRWQRDQRRAGRRQP